MESSRLVRVSGTDLSEMEADIDLAQAGDPALIGDARRPLPHAVVGLPRKFEVGPVDREPFVERSVGQHRAIGASVPAARSEEHTSELQSLMCISYAVF